MAMNTTGDSGIAITKVIFVSILFLVDCCVILLVFSGPKWLSVLYSPFSLLIVACRCCKWHARWHESCATSPTTITMIVESNPTARHIDRFYIVLFKRLCCFFVGSLLFIHSSPLLKKIQLLRGCRHCVLMLLQRTVRHRTKFFTKIFRYFCLT